MLLARGEEYAGAEHDVEEDVVSGANALRPLEEGGAVTMKQTSSSKLRNMPAVFSAALPLRRVNGSGPYAPVGSSVCTRTEFDVGGIRSACMPVDLTCTSVRTSMVCVPTSCRIAGHSEPSRCCHAHAF